MAELQLTPPNTCAVIDLGAVTPPATPVVYIGEGTGYDAKIGVPDTYSSFQEFDNPQDALTAALVIDPTYPAGNILGPIPYTVDTETGSGSYLYGDNVTLEFVVSSSLAGTTIAYQWFDGSGFPVAGATTDTLSLGNATEASAGTYTCEAVLSGTYSRTLTATGSFAIAVSPVSGSFYLTRTANNISAGLYVASQGFDRTTSTLDFPTIPSTIVYDSVDGFKTVGSPLDTGALDFELFINGAYVKTFVLPAATGTYTFTL